jgi:hypothetical protein
VLDGDTSDWRGVPAAVRDAIGDSRGAVDLGEVRVAHDAAWVYLLIDIGAELNLQALPGPLRLVLDVDGDAATGAAAGGLPGVDLTVVASPAVAGGRGHGVAVLVSGRDGQRSPYSIGLQAAPTHAARTFELRLRRGEGPDGAPPLFTGDRFAARLLHTDSAGTLLDATAAFTYALAPPAPVAPPQPVRDADALARAAGTTLRVLAWNVSDEGLREETDAFLRILRALDADVLLLDEIGRSITQAWLAAFAAQLGGGWTARLGPAGGRQRTAVLSRLPLAGVSALDYLPYPDSVRALDGEPMPPLMRSDLAGAAADGIPVSGAIVEAGGLRILVVPLDLQCCGHAGSAEDRLRVMTADAVANAVAAVATAQSVDAVVIGGDLNLVGSRSPLDRLARGLDPAGGDLSIADAPRLDGGSYATWRQRGAFPPGRLDFVLFSGSRLEQRRAFAFATEDLADVLLAARGLRRSDSLVSDHLPVVVDLAVRR